MKSAAEILVCFFHPESAIKPFLTSIASMIFFLNFSHAFFKKFMSSIAFVPSITLSAPRFKRSLMCSKDLIPPPT